MDIHTTNPVVENALKACNGISYTPFGAPLADRDSLPASFGGRSYTVTMQDGTKVKTRGISEKDAKDNAERTSGKKAISAIRGVNSATADGKVAKNAATYFKVGDIVTFKPFGRNVKFKVVLEHPTDDGIGQMLTVEAYKGGFKDHSVRFEKA